MPFPDTIRNNILSPASRIPDAVPAGMEAAIEKLKAATNKDECLEEAYDILTQKYRGDRAKTYLRFFDLFQSDLEKVWNKTGFLHCTTLNYLLKVLLVKSGHFSEKDIAPRWTLIWYVSPHQYLRVHTGTKTLDVDLWGRTYRIKLGDHAHGFHSRT